MAEENSNIREVKPNDRVEIDNLVSWDLHFVGIEAGKDMVIPSSVKNWKQLSVAEVDAQVKNGNGFFCGKDRLGSNAYIKIHNDEVRAYVFGSGTSGKIEKQKILDVDTVIELLTTSPKSKFEKKLAETVVTDAEKKMIIPLAKEAGIDDCESYKVVAIEKLTGMKFE